MENQIADRSSYGIAIGVAASAVFIGFATTRRTPSKKAQGTRLVARLARSFFALEDDDGDRLSLLEYFRENHAVTYAFGAHNAKVSLISSIIFQLGLTLLTKKIQQDVSRSRSDCTSGTSSSSQSTESTSFDSASAFSPANGGLLLLFCLSVAGFAITFMFQRINEPLTRVPRGEGGPVRRVLQLAFGIGFLGLALVLRFTQKDATFTTEDAVLYIVFFLSALIGQWVFLDPASIVLKYLIGDCMISKQERSKTAPAPSTTTTTISPAEMLVVNPVFRGNEREAYIAA